MAIERVRSVNPHRISWCCHEYGITPDELSEELEIPVANIQKTINGIDGLTFNQLDKIAEYFNRGVLFFLETTPVDDTQVHTVQFRTIASQKTTLPSKVKALIERVERQREIYLSLREDLEDIPQPVLIPPRLLGQTIRDYARIVRNWLGVGDTNDFDSYRKALEARGIMVFLSNGYNGKWQISKKIPVLGFTLFYQTCPVIVIKKQFPTARQTFTLMHELGHLLLHKTSLIDEERDIELGQGNETEANSFAGHLLIPDEFLSGINDATRPINESQYDEWIENWRKKWGVSGEVILRRLLDVNRLTQRQYKSYRQWKASVSGQKDDEGGTREWRHREPKHIFGDKFVRTVFDALYAEHITLAKASRYLDNLKINDLHELEKFCATN